MNTIQMAEQRAAQMRASWAGDTIATPKGAAVAALHRLVRALAALDATDRDEVRAMLAELIGRCDAAAWCDFEFALTDA